VILAVVPASGPESDQYQVKADNEVELHAVSCTAKIVNTGVARIVELVIRDSTGEVVQVITSPTIQAV
jgi:hypothetical protein